MSVNTGFFCLLLQLLAIFVIACSKRKCRNCTCTGQESQLSWNFCLQMDIHEKMSWYSIAAWETKHTNDSESEWWEAPTFQLKSQKPTERKEGGIAIQHTTKNSALTYQCSQCILWREELAAATRIHEREDSKWEKHFEGSRQWQRLAPIQVSHNMSYTGKLWWHNMHEQVLAFLPEQLECCSASHHLRYSQRCGHSPNPHSCNKNTGKKKAELYNKEGPGPQDNQHMVRLCYMYWYTHTAGVRRNSTQGKTGLKTRSVASRLWVNHPQRPVNDTTNMILIWWERGKTSEVPHFLCLAGRVFSLLGTIHHWYYTSTNQFASLVHWLLQAGDKGEHPMPNTSNCPTKPGAEAARDSNCSMWDGQNTNQEKNQENQEKKLSAASWQSGHHTYMVWCLSSARMALLASRPYL